MDWHALGVKLRVKSHELEAIQRNYPHDTMRCKHEMLACSLRGANPPTWRDIREALCQMGEHGSAEKIRKKHLQPTKGTYTGCVLFVVFTCIIFYDAYEWMQNTHFSPSELAKCQVLKWMWEGTVVTRRSICSWWSAHSCKLFTEKTCLAMKAQ